MTKYASGYWPFSIPAGVAIRVDVSGLDNPGELKLDIVSGGPAFLWFGREDTASAARMSAAGGSLQFDMACSANSDATRHIDRGPAMVTLFSLADTIGYLQFDADDDVKLPDRPRLEAAC